MGYFQSNELQDKSTVLHVYQGIDAETLGIEVAKVLASRGYEIKEGNPQDGVFERGNRIIRILLGAFHKYFKFGVRIEPGEGDILKVRVHKLTSGFSGGVIGVNQVKNELKGLAEALKTI